MSRRPWLFDNADGVALTTGNTVSADGASAQSVVPGTGGSCTYDSSLKQAGSTGVRLNPGSTNQQIRLPFAASNNRGAFSTYHGSATLPPVLTDIINVRSASGQLFRVAINTDGAVRVRTSTSPVTIVGTPAGAWVANRVNRIEVVFDNSGGTSAGVVTLSVYDVNSETADATVSSSTGNLGTATAAFIDIGSPNITASTWVHWFDSLVMDDGATSFIGPYVPFSVSGLAASSSTTLGEVTARSTASGFVQASSTVEGEVSARCAVSGSSSSSSSVSGQVSARRAVSGSVAVVSAAVEEVTAQMTVSGTVPVQSSISGAVTSMQFVTGSSAAITTVFGNVTGGTVPEPLPAVGMLTAVTPRRELTDVTPGRGLTPMTPRRGLEAT